MLPPENDVDQTHATAKRATYLIQTINREMHKSWTESDFVIVKKYGSVVCNSLYGHELYALPAMLLELCNKK